MANQTFVNTQTREKEIKSLFFNITYAPTAATGSMSTTAPIVLTKVALNSLQNGSTFTLQIAAAAANPTNTVLAVWTGTAAATVLTITPNNGTNNGATPVNITTAQVVELINTNLVAGKTITVTDGSSLKALCTATGGGATNVADGGEGDGLVATLTGAIDFVANNKVGFKSFALTATGKFRVTLDDKWVALRYANCNIIDSTIRDFTFPIATYDMNPTGANGYIDFFCATGGTATTPAVNAKIIGEVVLKNTTIAI